MRQPTFIILGAAKCGTTALASFITSHPDVFITNPKEPHFFDGNYEIGVDGYLEKYYSDWTNEKAAGEATPSYLSTPYVAERIKKSCPNIKLIVILRNPIDRAYSSWWMFHARGMEPLSFEDAINLEITQLNENNDIESIYSEDMVRDNISRVRAGKRICIRNYLQAGHYADHLEHYYAKFSKSDIKIVFSSQLRRNHEQTIRDIWDHIGVDSRELAPQPTIVNEALGQNSMILLKIVKVLGLMRARHILPSTIKSSIKNRLSEMGNRPEMSAQTRNYLLAYFKPHIQRLELLVDTDLSDWMT